MCLIWLRFQEESTRINTGTLINLREMAAKSEKAPESKELLIHKPFLGDFLL